MKTLALVVTAAASILWTASAATQSIDETVQFIQGKMDACYDPISENWSRPQPHGLDVLSGSRILLNQVADRCHLEEGTRYCTEVIKQSVFRLKDVTILKGPDGYLYEGIDFRCVSDTGKCIFSTYSSKVSKKYDPEQDVEDVVTLVFECAHSRETVDKLLRAFDHLQRRFEQQEELF